MVNHPQRKVMFQVNPLLAQITLTGSDVPDDLEALLIRPVAERVSRAEAASPAREVLARLQAQRAALVSELSVTMSDILDQLYATEEAINRAAHVGAVRQEVDEWLARPQPQEPVGALA